MDVAILMGADPEAAKDEMMEVLKFEMAIANISLPRWAIIIYFLSTVRVFVATASTSNP